MARIIYHILPGPTGGWLVKRSGAQRASGTFVRKSLALRAGSALARRQPLAQVVIHNAAGTIVGDLLFQKTHHRRLVRGLDRARKARNTREKTHRQALRQRAKRRDAAQRAASTRRRRQLARSTAARKGANRRRH